MRHDFLDRHSRLDSVIHRLPAATKLIAAIVLLLAVIWSPQAFIPVAIILVLVAAASRIPAGFLLKRLLLLEPFVLGVAVLSLFQPNGGRVFTLIALRSTLCLLIVILLSSATPFSELLRTLRKVRVPALLITTLTLMYRYLFVLIDETDRMRRARACRTFTPRRAHAWKSLSTVAGQLFIRASERADRIYAAMCARGWK
jgi:cobalt/nickel transport system permease protein